MSLSCYCASDYEWFYEISFDEFTANSSGRCKGCGSLVRIGDTVRHKSTAEAEEDGPPDYFECAGRICEKCGDLYESLLAAGFCIEDTGVGFISEAHSDYLDMVNPPKMKTPCPFEHDLDDEQSRK